MFRRHRRSGSPQSNEISRIAESLAQASHSRRMPATAAAHRWERSARLAAAPGAAESNLDLKTAAHPS
jgi:hypothetical protein